MREISPCYLPVLRGSAYLAQPIERQRRSVARWDRRRPIRPVFSLL